MYKAVALIGSLLIVVLAVLAAVQTVRLYRVQQEIESKISLRPMNISEPKAENEGKASGHLPGYPGAKAGGKGGSARGESDEAANENEARQRRIKEAMNKPSGASGDKAKNASAGNAAGTDQEKDRAGAASKAAQLVQDARKALDAGDFDTAAKLLADGIKSDPTNKQAYQMLAQLQHNLGQTQAELQTYQDWAHNVPGDALPHYMMADAYVRAGDRTSAYNELTQFQNMSNGSLSGYPMSAGLYRELGMSAEEGSALAAWVQAAPDSSDAHQMLADYERRNGDYNAAIKEYETVLSLAPGTASAYTSLGDIYRRNGQYDTAAQQYQAAIDLQPDDLTLRQQLAATYQASGDLQSALSTYQGIVDANPNSPQGQQAAQAVQRIERQLAAAGN